MFFVNFFKLVFFMIIVYFFYSIFRMLMFSARSTRERDAHRRKEADERMRARRGPGRSSGRDEVIELDKNQYKVE